MKPALITLLLLMVLSCVQQSPEEMIAHLPGYWEIEQVRLPDGSIKEFGMSSSVDFIEVNGSNGVRKKVMPQFDGTFLANDSAEKFELKIENDSLNLYYQTPFDSWKETVLKAKDSSLVILNRDGKMYRYKMFKGVSVAN